MPYGDAEVARPSLILPIVSGINKPGSQSDHPRSEKQDFHISRLFQFQVIEERIIRREEGTEGDCCDWRFARATLEEEEEEGSEARTKEELTGN